IDAEWPDAHGKPLQATIEKAFRVTAPDETQPDPAKWTIRPPRPGTRDPLVVQFEEPLDHAMLVRRLVVYDARGGAVAGSVKVSNQEQQWELVPQSPWQSGQYSLSVPSTLEDRAGNSIGRPFEVDIFEQVDREIVEEAVTLPFTVS